MDIAAADMVITRTTMVATDTGGHITGCGVASAAINDGGAIVVIASVVEFPLVL